MKFLLKAALIILIVLTLTSTSIFFILEKDYNASFSALSNSFLSTAQLDNQNKASSKPLNRRSKISNAFYDPISIGFNEDLEHYIFHERLKQFGCSKTKKFSKKECIAIKRLKFFESSGSTPQLFGNSSLKFELESDSKLLSKKQSGEILFIDCSPLHTFLSLKNFYNKTSAERAEKRKKALIKEFMFEKFKPLTVVLLVFDSTSRQSFYRNLKELARFFNSSVIEQGSEYSNDFVIYDFLGNNANSHSTIPNMAALLYGKSSESILNILDSSFLDNPEYSDLYIDYQVNNSIWSYYQNKGFVTMVSIDTINDYISKLTGRIIKSDHTTSSFWKLCNQYYKYDEFFPTNLCLGGKLPHQHSLDYLSEYLKNYIGQNRFAYTHINIAHEASGRNLPYADLDLKNFFIDTFNFYKQNKEDVVFFFMGDHGRSKGDTIYLDSFGENSLPFHFVVVNKEFIKKHKFHSSIEVNTERLLSRYDWHRTIKALANAPYMKISGRFEDISTEIPSILVFNEIASAERTCESIGISDGYCLSKNFINVSLDNWENNENLLFIVNSSISTINRLSNRTKSINYTDINLGKLFYIKELKINLFKEYPATHYLIMYSLESNENSRFVVHGAYSETTKGISFNLPHEFSSEKSFIKLSSTGEKILNVVKVWSIARFDYNYNAESTINSENRIFYSFNYFLLESGSICYDKCKAAGLRCNTFMFNRPFLEYLSEAFKIIYKGSKDSIEVHSTTVIVGNKEMCSTTAINSPHFCSCSAINI